MNNRSQGMMQGAQQGAAFGPWGALAGALIGGKMGGIQDSQQNMQNAGQAFQNGLGTKDDDDMLKMDDNDKQNIAVGMNNGYGGY